MRLRWEKRTTELNLAICEKAVDSDLERLKRQRAYAVARVARLTADIAPRLAGCGVEGLSIGCRCGLVGAKKTCRQWWLCAPCRARRTPQLGADIRRGLGVALQLATEEWGARGGRGMRPQIVLLTLTQKHSGDLSADQAALAIGWRKLYQRMHEDYGKFPYVAVWEATPGRDGLGHVHMHIAVIWAYRDWSRIREQWERACPTSQQFDIKATRKDKKESTPASVGNYLGKYLSKGADSWKFDARLRAEVSAAFYNQRSVMTSVGFWRRVPKCCRVCQERYRIIEVEKASFFDSIPDTGVISLYFHGTGPPPD